MARYRYPTSILWPTGHFTEFEAADETEALKKYHTKFPSSGNPPELQVYRTCVWQWVIPTGGKDETQ